MSCLACVLVLVMGVLQSCEAFVLSGAPPPLAGHGLSLSCRGVGARRPVPALRLLPADAQADAGERVFAAHCASCHAGGGNLVEAERSLEKAAIEQYLTGGFSEKAVAYQVSHGKKLMPAFAERLSEAEVAAVAVYVIKSAADKWD